MNEQKKYLCVWCDGESIQDEPFCPACERELALEVLHQTSQHVGRVRVNFTVGRIHPPKVQ